MELVSLQISSDRVPEQDLFFGLRRNHSKKLPVFLVIVLQKKVVIELLLGSILFFCTAQNVRWLVVF